MLKSEFDFVEVVPQSITTFCKSLRDSTVRDNRPGALDASSSYGMIMEDRFPTHIGE